MISATEWAVKHWQHRLAWMATLNDQQRHTLTQMCARNGAHFQSGERFLTKEPLHMCYVCGTNFHAGDRPLSSVWIPDPKVM